MFIYANFSECGWQYACVCMQVTAYVIRMCVCARGFVHSFKASRDFTRSGLMRSTCFD